ncbi:MAG TPA: DUF4253 domain-containing protein [Acidimicrobiales bacterium]|nr:DUF4253 domain-containing protein [Acidimicrobiales bacterium]
MSNEGEGPVELNRGGYRAARPGRLPPDGVTDVGGVVLPAGRQARASGAQVTEPVLWISDEIVDAGDRWTQLRRVFPRTGLWPLVLDTLDFYPERPWDDGEFDPGSSSSPEGIDVESTVERWWHDMVHPDAEEPESLEELDPFGQAFPGLAPAPAAEIDEDAPDRVAAGLRARLGLVPVTRPADVLAVLGWQGPANYYTDVGPLSAVLRSWEDRFGAEPVAVGFDTLVLGVRRAPVSATDSLRIAAEHFAVCPDNVFQGAGSIAAYADEIRGERAWAFWWD